MSVQPLSPDQWERFRRIRMTALGDSPDAFGTTLDEVLALGEADWRSQLESLPTFVAVEHERDVGVVRGAPHDDDASAAFLLSMWVEPSARGRGVGERLIRAVISWARSEGFDRLILDVADDNLSAVGLYSRMGFEPTGETGTLPPPRTHIREHRRVRVLESAWECR